GTEQARRGDDAEAHAMRIQVCHEALHGICMVRPLPGIAGERHVRAPHVGVTVDQGRVLRRVTHGGAPRQRAVSGDNACAWVSKTTGPSVMLAAMSRIPYPDVAGLPAIMQKMLAGTPLNVVRIGAHASPPLFEAQGRLGWAVANPEVLDPRLRETVVLRVAYLSESTYELHHHLPLARAAGLRE